MKTSKKGIYSAGLKVRSSISAGSWSGYWTWDTAKREWYWTWVWTEQSSNWEEA